MNFTGLLAGVATLLLIGLGFAWVIRVERHLGWQWWPYVMAGGIALLALSLFVTSFWTSAVVGILGASLAWGSTELPEQAERVRKGWFRAAVGPKRLPPLAGRIERWPRPRL